MSEIQQLIQKLGDRNTKVRLDAANELASLGANALPAVTGLLSHKDINFRRVAAYILGKIRNPVSVDALIEALGDDTPDVRKTAAQALNRIGKPAIPPLIRSLGNISKDIRASAVWSLSKMGDMVVEPLCEALFSEVKDVRASAVWALSKIGDAAIAPLMELINHDDKNVRESARWGLAKIGEPAIRNLATRWNVRIAKDAIDGEDQADSVDVEDLLANGEEAIKQWIKYMLEKKSGKEPSASLEEGSGTPEDASSDSNDSNNDDSNLDE